MMVFLAVLTVGFAYEWKKGRARMGLSPTAVSHGSSPGDRTGCDRHYRSLDRQAGRRQ